MIFNKIKHLIQHASFSVIAQILMAITSLLQLKIFTTSFAPDSIGVYTTILTFNSLFQTVMFGPITNTLNRFRASFTDEERFQKFIGSMNLFSVIFLSLVSLIYAIYLITNSKTIFSFSTTYVIMLSYALSSMISALGTTYLISSSQSQVLLKLTIFDISFRPAFLYLTIHLTKNYQAQAQTVFLLNAIVTGMPFGVVVLINKMPKVLVFSNPNFWIMPEIRKEFMVQIKYALGFIPVSILAFFCLYSDRLMAIKFLKPEDLAKIAVIQQTVCSPLQILIAVIFAALLPSIFNLKPNDSGLNSYERHLEAITRTRHIAMFFGAISVPVLLILYFIGPLFIRILSSVAYVPDVDIILFYSASGFMIAISQILSIEMLILHKPHLVSLPKIAQLIVLIAAVSFYANGINFKVIARIFFFVSTVQLFGTIFFNLIFWRIEKRKMF